jgi:hypothetical protein
MFECLVGGSASGFVPFRADGTRLSPILFGERA